MNECEKYREMMSAMLDGELDAAEREQLAAHMSLCAECRELYGLLSAVSGPDAWELPEIPEGLHGHIMSGVKAAAAERKKRARVVRLRPLAVAAACMAVIVGVIFGVPRVFRMGSSGPGSMFNTAAAASSNSAPAGAPADTCAPADIPAPAEAPTAADNNAGDIFGYHYSTETVTQGNSEGQASNDGAGSASAEGGNPEAAPVPEPDFVPGAPDESEAETPELEIDIDRSIVTVESDGTSVSERLNRGDTLIWLRAIIEDLDGGGFDVARIEVFRREGADYEVYFYHDGGKLMGSLSEKLENGIELEKLADFAQFEKLASGEKR